MRVTSFVSLKGTQFKDNLINILVTWIASSCGGVLRLVGITFPPAQHLNDRIGNVRLSKSGGHYNTKTMSVIALCIHLLLIE